MTAPDGIDRAAALREPPLGYADDDASASPVDTDFDATVARLAGLSPVDYDRARKGEAKRLGIQLSTLDNAVKAARPGSADAGSGEPLEWPEIEPWPYPVSTAELLDSITATVRRYIVLPAGSDAALALWIAHAWVFDVHPVTPRLAILSPEKRCGKTTTLEIVAALVPRQLLVSNVTTAAVFRVIAEHRPTLLIDEADTFLAANDDLRGVLNSGHRSTGTVTRTVGDNHEVRAFRTFCPLAIAAIGKIPGTLADRSVRIELRRKAPNEAVERWRVDRAAGFDDMLRLLARWASDQRGALAGADPDVPGRLHDRAADNWRPLLAIADLGGPQWAQRARNAALLLSAGADDDAWGTMLLEDIRAIFEESRGTDWIGTQEIVAKLADMTERPWPEASRGRPLSEKKLADLLKPYAISSSRSHGWRDRRRGYDRGAFLDAWSRYLPAEGPCDPSMRPEPSSGAAFRAAAIRPGMAPAGRVEHAPKPSSGAASGQVDGLSSRQDAGAWNAAAMLLPGEQRL
ncbi:MAG: DUF3631 domain-containing protein [Geminicoccaceae bacterium]